MIYNCPFCGEIESTDIKFTCLGCSSEEIKEIGDDQYMCPNCGQQNADEVRFTCNVCNSDDVTK
jgi:hypothetical protein